VRVCFVLVCVCVYVKLSLTQCEGFRVQGLVCVCVYVKLSLTQCEGTCVNLLGPKP
jgi:hypothetical protein